MKLKIKNERERKGWTQSYVANRVGVTQPMLFQIETGQRRPSYDVLVKLLDLFGYDDPRKLFEVVENAKKPDGNQAETNTIKG